MHPEDRLNVWLLLQKNNESWRRSEKALTVAGKCQEHPQKIRRSAINLTMPRLTGELEVFTRSGQVYDQAFSPRTSRGYGDWKNSQPVRRIFRLAYRFSPSHYCPEHIPMAGDDDSVMGDP
jgi:hypothetical protein